MRHTGSEIPYGNQDKNNGSETKVLAHMEEEPIQRLTVATDLAIYQVIYRG